MVHPLWREGALQVLRRRPCLLLSHVRFRLQRRIPRRCLGLLGPFWHRERRQLRFEPSKREKSSPSPFVVNKPNPRFFSPCFVGLPAVRNRPVWAPQLRVSSELHRGRQDSQVFVQVWIELQEGLRGRSEIRWGKQESLSLGIWIRRWSIKLRR